VCEAELVIRYSRGTNAPFWACSDFSRTRCQYTRSVRSEAAPAAHQHPGTPQSAKKEESPNPSREKRPIYVTPDSAQQLKRSRHSDATIHQPVCLFPRDKSLRDTFVGADLADDLISSGIPSRVYSRSEQSEEISRLYYEEDKSSNKYTYFSYWYKENRTDPGSLGNEPLKPVVLELFAGAGGMSLGLKKAGFDVKYAIEKDFDAAETLRSNHKDTVVFRQNIEDFLDDTKPKNPCLLREIDHIQASPPCQDFSDANQMSSHLIRDSERNALMRCVPNAVRLYKPKTTCMENVTGLLSSPDRMRYLQDVVAELLKLEYQVSMMVLNAQDYGVPQHRKRVFLFAARKGYRLPQVPVPTSFGGQYSVGEALANLEAIDPTLDGVPVLVGGMETVYDHSEYIVTHVKPVDELKKNGVAATVRRQNHIHHYSQNRSTTIRERARLQTFPDWYHFCGRPIQQANQIGNAVPVNLAEAVGRSIIKTYKE